VILYLDTSALFKLYVDEAGSDAVHAAVAAAESVAVCRIAWAEAMSALARRGREVPADQTAIEQARQALRNDWPNFLVLEVSQKVVEQAGEYADTFALRALRQFDDDVVGLDRLRRRSAARPCRQDGQEVRILTAAPSVRSHRRPGRISSALRKRTWVAMSGRLAAKVPASPQQRSDSLTSAHQQGFRGLDRAVQLDRRMAGVVVHVARAPTPSSLTPFSIRYSWMSMMRQPGKSCRTGISAVDPGRCRRTPARS
jgi:uncharacterized protein